MAVLTSEDRAEIWAEYMRYSSNIRERIGLSKGDLRAAVDATDQWIEDNKASYNQALPTAAQNNLTGKQKTRLFMAVAAKKFDLEA